jgi:iron-sulfur cluster repair protein YtfE (RIC family)
LSRPIDVIRCFHNAFRRDSSQIDNSVLKIAQEGGDLTPLFTRLQIMGEILDYHARGEEAAVFPAVDKLTPFVAEAYLIDHRELDNMVSGLKIVRKAPNRLIAARATAVLDSHLRIHLNKEDTHLYPILRERTTDEEQASILRVMSGKVPPERFPLLIQWLFPSLDLGDQVTAARTWMSIMPPQVFAMARPLIKKNVAENWTELTRQIPGLSDN